MFENPPKAKIQLLEKLICPFTNLECLKHFCKYEGCQKEDLRVFPAIPNPLTAPKNSICEDCPTPEDCSRYGCQWGD